MPFDPNHTAAGTLIGIWEASTLNQADNTAVTSLPASFIGTSMPMGQSSAPNQPLYLSGTGINPINGHPAIYYDGVNDFLSAGNIAAATFEFTDPFSLMVLIEPSTLVSGTTFFAFCKEGSGNSDGYAGWSFGIYNGGSGSNYYMYFGLNGKTNGYMQSVGSIPVSLGAPHLLIATFTPGLTQSASVIKLYLDGVLDTGPAFTSVAMDTSKANSSPMIIGGRSNGSGDIYIPFKGYIAVAGVWSGVLASGDVTDFRSYYAGYFGVPSSPYSDSFTLQSGHSSGEDLKDHVSAETGVTWTRLDADTAYQISVIKSLSLNYITPNDPTKWNIYSYDNVSIGPDCGAQVSIKVSPTVNHPYDLGFGVLQRLASGGGYAFFFGTAPGAVSGTSYERFAIVTIDNSQISVNLLADVVGKPVTSGGTYTIRSRTSGNNLAIDYSKDGGTTWSVGASAVDGNNKYPSVGKTGVLGYLGGGDPPQVYGYIALTTPTAAAQASVSKSSIAPGSSADLTVSWTGGYGGTATTFTVDSVPHNSGITFGSGSTSTGTVSLAAPGNSTGTTTVHIGSGVAVGSYTLSLTPTSGSVMAITIPIYVGLPKANIGSAFIGPSGNTVFAYCNRIDSGSGLAAATATVDPNPPHGITSINISDYGSSYPLVYCPRVVITAASGDSTGKGAFAIATVNAGSGDDPSGNAPGQPGVINHIRLTSPGTGYTAAPKVDLSAMSINTVDRTGQISLTVTHGVNVRTITLSKWIHDNANNFMWASLDYNCEVMVDEAASVHKNVTINGYTFKGIPSVHFVGGNPGAAASATAIMSEGTYGVVVGFLLGGGGNTGGSGYNSVPQVYLDPTPSHALATCTLPISGTYVNGVTIDTDHPGAGYLPGTNPGGQSPYPTVPYANTFIGDGTGAYFRANQQRDGTVTNAGVNGGSGYTSTPIVVMDPPSYAFPYPIQNQPFATVSGGSVTAISVPSTAACSLNGGHWAPSLDPGRTDAANYPTGVELRGYVTNWGCLEVQSSSNPGDTAVFTFAGLIPGDYDLYVTWPHQPADFRHGWGVGATNDARHTVEEGTIVGGSVVWGSSPLVVIDQDQTNSNSGQTFDDVSAAIRLHKLTGAPFTVVHGVVVRITISNVGSNSGSLWVDTMRLKRVQRRVVSPGDTVTLNFGDGSVVSHIGPIAAQTLSNDGSTPLTPMALATDATWFPYDPGIPSTMKVGYNIGPQHYDTNVRMFANHAKFSTAWNSGPAGSDYQVNYGPKGHFTADTLVYLWDPNTLTSPTTGNLTGLVLPAPTTPPTQIGVGTFIASGAPYPNGSDYWNLPRYGGSYGPTTLPGGLSYSGGRGDNNWHVKYHVPTASPPGNPEVVFSGDYTNSVTNIAGSTGDHEFSAQLVPTEYPDRPWYGFGCSMGVDTNHISPTTNDYIDRLPIIYDPTTPSDWDCVAHPAHPVFYARIANRNFGPSRFMNAIATINSQTYGIKDFCGAYYMGASSGECYPVTTCNVTSFGPLSKTPDPVLKISEMDAAQYWFPARNYHNDPFGYQHITVIKCQTDVHINNTTIGNYGVRPMQFTNFPDPGHLTDLKNATTFPPVSYGPYSNDGHATNVYVTSFMYCTPNPLDSTNSSFFAFGNIGGVNPYGDSIERGATSLMMLSDTYSVTAPFFVSETGNYGAASSNQISVLDLINLSNDTNTDLWIPVPQIMGCIRKQDVPVPPEKYGPGNGVYDLGRLIAMNLKPPLKWYCELSNEVWNGGQYQYRMSMSQANASYYQDGEDLSNVVGFPGNNQDIGSQQWFGLMSSRCWDAAMQAFDDVLGVGGRDRVVKVLGAHIAFDTPALDYLKYINYDFTGGVVVVATYMFNKPLTWDYPGSSPNELNISDVNEAFDSLDVDGLIDIMRCHMLESGFEFFIGKIWNSLYANGYGIGQSRPALGPGCYEGGFDHMCPYGTSQDRCINYSLWVARHPRAFHMELARMQIHGLTGLHNAERFTYGDFGNISTGYNWIDFLSDYGGTEIGQVGTGGTFDSPGSENRNPYSIPDLLSQTGGAVRKWNADRVTGQAATKIVFSIPVPSTVFKGYDFTIEVWAVNSIGSLDANYGGSVTVIVSTNPGGATLAGTSQVSNFSGGKAKFTMLTMDVDQTGYAITVSSGSLTSAVSGPFSVMTEAVLSGILAF